MAGTTGLRQRALAHLDVTLVGFDLVLSAAFLLISSIDGSIYFKGVGVGLLIAGATGTVATAVKRSRAIGS